MRTIWIGVLLAVSAAVGTADVACAQAGEPGKNEYLKSCASCHGVTGKGDGPVAATLTRPPADLTRLSESNHGVFPFTRVYNVIDGRDEVEIDGSRDMPAWGEVYRRDLNSRLPQSSMHRVIVEAMVRERILWLIQYISTLQGK
jgi:mono/diheme cytochrome c family protein